MCDTRGEEKLIATALGGREAPSCTRETVAVRPSESLISNSASLKRCSCLRSSDGRPRFSVNVSVPQDVALVSGRGPLEVKRVTFDCTELFSGMEAAPSLVGGRDSKEARSSLSILDGECWSFV